VALAPDRDAWGRVAVLARGADLLVPAAMPGRFLLATIMALLRWRSGR
jgi:hypothetical protein